MWRGTCEISGLRHRSLDRVVVTVTDSRPHSERPDLIEKARDLAGHGSAPMYDHLLYSLADALAETQETIRGFEGVVRNHEENEKRLEEQLEAARSDLGEIEQLVRHEWRDKDHNAAFVLATIEQVLDASIPAKRPSE